MGNILSEWVIDVVIMDGDGDEYRIMRMDGCE